MGGFFDPRYNTAVKPSRVLVFVGWSVLLVAAASLVADSRRGAWKSFSTVSIFLNVSRIDGPLSGADERERNPKRPMACAPHVDTTSAPRLSGARNAGCR